MKLGSIKAYILRGALAHYVTEPPRPQATEPVKKFIARDGGRGPHEQTSGRAETMKKKAQINLAVSGYTIAIDFDVSGEPPDKVHAALMMVAGSVRNMTIYNHVMNAPPISTTKHEIHSVAWTSGYGSGFTRP
jgi:hypothetical protein